MYMKISNRRLHKIRKMKNQTRKRNKSHKRRHKKGGKKRSFRRKNYVNLRRQTLKRQRGGAPGNKGIQTLNEQADVQKEMAEARQKQLLEHNKKRREATAAGKAAAQRWRMHQHFLKKQIGDAQGNERQMRNQARGLRQQQRNIQRVAKLEQQKKKRTQQRKEKENNLNRPDLQRLVLMIRAAP